uniref:Uncharacterized protein n=1 Tax=Vespula pensylvanica TaxID=30213 RepID=A0A834UB43_VESPE|nr:hypothetical protein H0235_006988 [Vespula pensylvanica]
MTTIRIGSTYGCLMGAETTCITSGMRTEHEAIGFKATSGLANEPAVVRPNLLADPLALTVTRKKDQEEDEEEECRDCVLRSTKKSIIRPNRFDDQRTRFLNRPNENVCTLSSLIGTYNAVLER